MLTQMLPKCISPRSAGQIVQPATKMAGCLLRPQLKNRNAFLSSCIVTILPTCLFRYHTMAADAMQIDSPATSIEELLKAHAAYETGVTTALRYLRIDDYPPLSEDLQLLKSLTPEQTANSSCGIMVYSLQGLLKYKILDLEPRNSKLFFERDCYPRLYRKLVQIWSDNAREKIILTGNAGIGKSWFQVYFLRRLLVETGDSLFRFVVRQVGEDYYLMDLETCLGYELQGRERDVLRVLDNHGKILYLYEPASEVNQPPLTTAAPSLSTLSPRPTRIKEYKKSHPRMLYMPCWEFNELDFVAGREGMNLDVLERNYLHFGGIPRYTLEQETAAFDENKEELVMRCAAVSADMLRSIAADIDDDPNAGNRNNISGFVVSYTDIPQDDGNENSFATKSLTMTSEFARKQVEKKMSLGSPREHLEHLLKHLDRQSKDITGKDLEASVVHLLAAGTRTVQWDYQPIGGNDEWLQGTKLNLTKREINREGTFELSKINYPTERMFSLIDCFTMIDRVYWAFQMTWHYQHPFKLATLHAFRAKLGLTASDPLNIVFVNPVHAQTYWQRNKKAYLAKGEQLGQPILNHKKRTLMEATDVDQMWANTHIFVAFPKDDDWQRAIRDILYPKR